MLQQLDVVDFNREIAVPAVADFEQLGALLVGSGLDPGDVQEALNKLAYDYGAQQVGVGVREVLSALDTAVSGPGGPDGLPARLATELAQLINMRNPGPV